MQQPAQTTTHTPIQLVLHVPPTEALISAAIGVVTMEFFPGAYKKATAALDEAARARLRGPFISDTVAPSPAPSGGAADADDDLMDSVDEFYNGYGEHGTDGGAVAKDAVASRATEWKEALRLTLADAAADAAAVRIRAEAERIVRDAGPAAVGGGGGIRKHLVERLRARGYDARNNALLLCSSHFSISYIQHGTLTFLFVLGSSFKQVSADRRGEEPAASPRRARTSTWT